MRAPARNRAEPRLGWLVAALALALPIMQFVAAARRPEPPARHPVCLFSAPAEDAPEPSLAGPANKVRS